MIDEQTIITEYRDEKLTIQQISDKYELKFENIRKILKKHNIPWHRKYLVDFSQTQIDEIILQYQNGVSCKNIALQYNISAPAITRLLKINGISIVSSLHKYDEFRQIPITNIQKQFIVGTMLGDGCLYRDTESSNYKLSIGQCEKQKEYFDWKIDMMKPFITSFRQSIDKRKNSIMWQATSISHPDFNELGQLFYTGYKENGDRIKVIPLNLETYFTPLTLAIWVMDDGNLNAGVNMRIASMSFTEKENIMLQQYLEKLFGLQSKVKVKGGFGSLSLNKENTQKLSNIIRPHIVSCMAYKIMI